MRTSRLARARRRALATTSSRRSLLSLILATACVTVACAGENDSSYPKACSDVYDTSRVPTFELEMSAAELTGMEQDCAQKVKKYRPATFRYGSESADVMVRLKGNWSFRCEKKQFVISFNEVNSDARFHGLRKIMLDAPWYDPSLLAERLGFSFMRRTGNYSSCSNSARLMFNGQYYGAYTSSERIDKEYLQRHFSKADAEGNLYEGGKELKTNESENDTSRRDALFAAKDVASIAALADLDQAVKEWAALAMLPDPDSYWAGVEINYYLYDHPSRGFVWLPVDMDLTMKQGVTNANTSSIKVGVQEEFVRADPFTYQNSAWGREPIYRTVLSDEAWCNRFLDALRAARDAYDVQAMSKDLDTWAAQIADAVDKDPHKPYTMQTHLEGVATLKAFMPQRLAFVDTWLSTARCPVTKWP
ncbi:MAG TPA: CotH kinase family protein [Polyangiaceae bacterium]|nr:CotH kinase family protein [Polyangiaceae bacterium]